MGATRREFMKTVGAAIAASRIPIEGAEPEQSCQKMVHGRATSSVLILSDCN